MMSRILNSVWSSVHQYVEWYFLKFERLSTFFVREKKIKEMTDQGCQNKAEHHLLTTSFRRDLMMTF